MSGCVCLFGRVCVYVCELMSVLSCACSFVCVRSVRECVCVSACVYVCQCVCVRACVCLGACICERAWVCACTNIHTSKYTDTYTHTHTHTHSHTHTHIHPHPHNKGSNLSGF